VADLNRAYWCFVDWITNVYILYAYKNGCWRTTERLQVCKNLPACTTELLCFVSYGSYLRPVNSVGKVASYGLKHRDSVPGGVPYLWVLMTSISDLGYRSSVRVSEYEAWNTPPALLSAEVKNEWSLPTRLLHAFTTWCKEGKIFLFAIRHCCQYAAWRNTRLRNREFRKCYVFFLHRALWNNYGAWTNEMNTFQINTIIQFFNFSGLLLVSNLVGPSSGRQLEECFRTHSHLLDCLHQYM
jgi:hypothetical protein